MQEFKIFVICRRPYFLKNQIPITNVINYELDFSVMEIENELNIFKSVIEFLNNNEELKQIFSGEYLIIFVAMIDVS